MTHNTENVRVYRRSFAAHAAALLFVIGLAVSAVSHAYTPCSGAAMDSANPGKVLATFPASNYEGAICDLPTLAASNNPADIYWLEIQSLTSTELWCSATLWVSQSAGGFAKLQGGTPLFGNALGVAVETDAVTNTTGIDTTDTINSVQCSTSDGGGSGGGGGGGPGVSSGSGVQLFGNSTYTVSGSQVTLHVGGILNSSTSATTGTLRVELWLASTAYSGGGIFGYRVATYQLGTLGPGQPYNAFTETVPLSGLPGPGSYYADLLVTEYNSNTCGSSDHFCIDTGGTFTNQYVIANMAGSGGSGNVVLSGSYSYAIDFATNTLQFNVSQIADTSSAYTTNPLRLEWWLFPNPYTGGGQQGYHIASYQITGSSNGQLGPGQWFQNLTGQASVSNLPSSGTYYPGFMVTEYTQNCGSSDGYCYDTYGTFPQTLTIPAPTSNSGNPSGGGTSSGDGGSGGGGSIGWESLLLLGVLVALKEATRRTRCRKS